MIVGKDADYLGFIQTNEKWFIATKTIIDKFYAYLNSINNHSKISVQHKYPTR